MQKDSRNTNRLSRETSPYLLQHAGNPVYWFPWGDEPFERAREENKPVFLSIGYSTCHWCHVMERESFEDAEIASILNDNFISVKVDREEHPDVDDIYMNAVQMMTGSGGWPLSVFLTSEGEPFYGGTYFPPDDRYGRVGFRRLLVSIIETWDTRKSEVAGIARRISGIISDVENTGVGHKVSGNELDAAFDHLKSVFDTLHGGFGAAPKFPQPGYLSLLLEHWYRTGDDSALLMVEETIRAIASGGIHDHAGGGFHRYSTDNKWLIPHFEKMLYDQALLAGVSVDLYRITGKSEYEDLIRSTVDYVLRELASESGGFFSAEDADSDGAEGLFYTWKKEETIALLGENDAETFNAFFGISDEGNFEKGRSILNIRKPVEEFSRNSGLDRIEIDRVVSEGKKRLLNERNNRTRPFLDDKIITAWNGLMISALSRAGSALSEPVYIEAATHAAAFVLEKRHGSGKLPRYCRNGRAEGAGFLDDYAFMITGLVDLYQTGLERRWLDEADRLASEMIELFADRENGGFFLSGAGSSDLFTRSKPFHDGALPSGNSVAALGLFRLGLMLDREDYSSLAKRTVDASSSKILSSPVAMTTMLSAAALNLEASKIVISGETEDPETREMLHLISLEYLPYTVITLQEPGEGLSSGGRKREDPSERYTGNLLSAEGEIPTAHICRDLNCGKPAWGVGGMADILGELVRR